MVSLITRLTWGNQPMISVNLLWSVAWPTTTQHTRASCLRCSRRLLTEPGSRLNRVPQQTCWRRADGL